MQCFFKSKIGEKINIYIYEEKKAKKSTFAIIIVSVKDIIEILLNYNRNIKKEIINHRDEADNFLILLKKNKNMI